MAAAERKNMTLQIRSLAEITDDFMPGEELKSLIEEIRSSYPFTLLSKGKVQHKADKLGEYLWLKDPHGNFILVNTRFAGSMGLRPQQLEGKNELELLPEHLKDFYASARYFILSTSNILVREGFPFPLIQSAAGEQVRTVEVPLCDVDNNVVAVLGFTHRRVPERTGKHNEGQLLAASAIKNLQQPVLLLDNNGIIRIVSAGFQESFPELDVHPGMNFSHIFDDADMTAFFENVFLKDGSEMKKVVKLPQLGQAPVVVGLKRFYDELHENVAGITAAVEKKISGEEKHTTGDVLYETLMQTSPDAIFIYDSENLRFLDVNRAAMHLYGYTRDEFLQMDLTDLYAPEDIQTLLQEPENIARSAGGFTGPWHHRKKDGSFVYVEISKSSVDFGGTPASFNVVRDISEKMELRRYAQFFNGAFDSLSDLIFVTDAQGFILSANYSTIKNLGFEYDDLKNTSFLSLVSESSRQAAGRFFSRRAARDVESIEAGIRNSQGEILICALEFIPVKDENSQISGYNIICKLQAEEKPAQQQSVQPASDQPAAAAADSSPADSSAAALQAQPAAAGVDARFLANIFHDILTPVNVILGFAQEITESIEEPTAEQNEFSDIIKQNSRVLLQTMDSAQEYAQLLQNSIEMDYSSTAFTDVLDTIQANTKKVSDDRHVEFNYGKISSSLQFETDRHKFTELVSILVAMSMQITKEKNIYISASQYDDNSFIVSIKDNRNEISAHLLNNLKEFYLTEENNIKKEFGIPRYRVRMARRLLELLQGSVEMVLKSGEVTEFGFLFPVRPAIASQPQRSPADAVLLKDKNVSAEKTRQDAEPAKAAPQMREIPFGASDSQSPAYTQQASFRQTQERQNATQQTNSAARQEQHHHQPERTKNGRGDLSNYSCLYLEDQLDSQLLFKVQLKEFRELDCAVSFEDAIPLLQERRYDIIVLDMNLQGEYNGLDAMRIIRQMPGHQDTIIIAATAYVLPGDRDKFLAAGFNGFISKPIFREKLSEILEKMNL